MKITGIALTLAATIALAGLNSPAFATDQRTAVGNCIDRGTACKWSMDRAGWVDIFVDGHWIMCPPVGDCELVYKTATTPKLTGMTLAKALARVR
jgi:hypothetical protein